MRRNDLEFVVNKMDQHLNVIIEGLFVYMIYNVLIDERMLNQQHVQEYERHRIGRRTSVQNDDLELII